MTAPRVLAPGGLGLLIGLLVLTGTGCGDGPGASGTAPPGTTARPTAPIGATTGATTTSARRTSTTATKTTPATTTPATTTPATTTPATTTPATTTMTTTTTTIISAATTSTSAWAPTAREASAYLAVGTLLDAWGAKDRAQAREVAASAAIDNLFALTYPSAGVGQRGCSSPPDGLPATCIYSYGSTGEILSFTVTPFPEGWGVTMVQLENS